MTARTRSRRLFALLGGVSFALLSLTPGIVRPCPMHGVSAHATSDSAGSMAGHGAHHGAELPAPEQAPAHPCDCATTCCAAPAVALHDASTRVVATVRQITESRSRPAARASVPAREHLLPFSIGPPPSMSG